MKRIYLLSLWLLACLVLPMKGQAVAQADLLNSERIHLTYDYQLRQSLRHLINAHDQALKQGNKIPYISIWRTKQGNSGITGTVNDGGTYYNDGQIRPQRVYKENLNAMILPADFGDEKYKLPNLMYKKAYGIAYDDEP